jgi:hypothetical protein
MGQLRALQEELKKLLPVGGTEEKSRFWKEGLPARLQVYRNTIHGNCTDTLDADYPLTKKQFSENDWFDLSRDFFTKYPPSAWELNKCIVSFPKFLKQKKTKPHVVELARYELTDLQTFIHTSVVKKGWGVTNPTVTVQVFQHQIYDWVHAQCPPHKPPLQKTEVLVFYRDTHHDCYVRKADPLMLLILDHFRTPKAQLAALEPAREKLLPGNSVDLNRVLNELVQNDMVLGA